MNVPEPLTRSHQWPGADPITLVHAEEYRGHRIEVYRTTEAVQRSGGRQPSHRWYARIGASPTPSNVPAGVQDKNDARKVAQWRRGIIDRQAADAEILPHCKGALAYDGATGTWTFRPDQLERFEMVKVHCRGKVRPGVVEKVTARGLVTVACVTPSNPTRITRVTVPMSELRVRPPASAVAR